MKCKPKVVFLDLDGTIWSSHDISAQTPPFKPLGGEEIVDYEGNIVKLKPGVREFLIWARKADIKVYSLSWNIPEIAYNALKAFGIYGMFKGHCIEYHPYKGRMMKNAVEKFKLNVKPCQIVYVDDRRIHLDNVRKEVGDVVFIQMNVDIKDFYELRSVLENMLVRDANV